MFRILEWLLTFKCSKLSGKLSIVIKERVQRSSWYTHLGFRVSTSLKYSCWDTSLIMFFIAFIVYFKIKIFNRNDVSAIFVFSLRPMRNIETLQFLSNIRSIIFLRVISSETSGTERFMFSLVLTKIIFGCGTVAGHTGSVPTISEFNVILIKLLKHFALCLNSMKTEQEIAFVKNNTNIEQLYKSYQPMETIHNLIKKISKPPFSHLNEAF
ncbi:hypothetical protein AGLY_003987 [Aphis glycines]|uniref:Uncharacterized protein n=1 Tax=Aphis glycines TaxID=307491 RepID=A0A6G0TWT5_APHGL|nr:hypothetical protein AGLY_003987 [Aphis glycines]